MNNQFAEIIKRNIESLVNDWAAAVRAEKTITSDEDLSESGLHDHIPQVLEEVAELLRHNITPNVTNTRESRVAAYTRYRQTYRLRDLVAEISLLRRTIFDCLGDAMLNPEINVSSLESINAVRLINAYLDNELLYGISIYNEQS